MLQIERTAVAPSGLELRDQEDGDGISATLNFLRGVLRRQYAVVLFTTALTLSAAVLYLRVTPPTYTAHVRVLLGNPKPQFVQQQSLVAEPTFDVTQIETQLQVLQSRAIAISVINQLKLAGSPELNPSSSSWHSLARQFRTWLGDSTKISEPGASDLPEDVITAFQDRLSANRITVSNVIEIAFSWGDAERAALIANAVASAYINDQLSAKFEANRTAAEWLQERLRKLGEQAQAAERAVAAYKAQNNIVSSGGKLVDEQQVSDINSRLVAARTQTAEMTARLNRYESILNDPAVSQSIGSVDAAGADALTSPILTGLRQQYLELSRRESEYSAKYGREHMSVVNLRNRMRDIRTSIIDEVRRMAAASRSDLEVAKQRQQEAEKQLAEAVSLSKTTTSAEVTLHELEAKAKGYRDLYDSFLQRYTGSAQQEPFPISEARVIYPASTPQGKSKPKTSLALLLAFFGGIGLGAGLGLIRDLMDRVFRTPGQLETALGLPCISVVPLLQTSKSRKPNVLDPPTEQDLQQRIVSSKSPSHWAVVNMPLSRFAESIRSIKLSADLTPGDNSNKVIGITSSLPHEGKSTIAASLAQLIGQSGKSVIVVDCDLRNPSLSSTLAPNAAVGLLEVIFGTSSLDDAIWSDPKTNLAFLPVVKRRPLTHTSEILTAEQMRKLCATLRSTYDYVVIDLPPLTPVVDVRAMSPLVDCFVLVVEWGRTKIDVVQHALHTAPSVYDNLVGVVLNKTDIKSMARYDAYRSDYYSDSHYAHYGLTDIA